MRIHLYGVAAILLFAAPWSTVNAQSETAEHGDAVPEIAEQDLELEPLPETGADTGTDGEFTSTPIGKRKKWQLDKGHFSTDEKSTGISSPDAPSDDYSGFRLRRPTPK